MNTANPVLSAIFTIASAFCALIAAAAGKPMALGASVLMLVGVWFVMYFSKD